MSQIRDQFFSTLKASESFKVLSPQQQQELLAAYENADDRKFESALRIVQAVEAELTEKIKKITEDQMKLALSIKTSLEQFVKVQRVEDEAKDRKISDQILDDLEQQIKKL